MKKKIILVQRVCWKTVEVEVDANLDEEEAHQLAIEKAYNIDFTDVTEDDAEYHTIDPDTGHEIY